MRKRNREWGVPFLHKKTAVRVSRQGKIPGVGEDYSPVVLRGVFPVDCPADLVDFPVDFFRGEYFV